MKMIDKLIMTGLALVVGVFFFGIAVCIVQWAWNLFMPTVFGLPNITWWQTVAFIILTLPIRMVGQVKSK